MENFVIEFKCRKIINFKCGKIINFRCGKIIDCMFGKIIVYKCGKKFDFCKCGEIISVKGWKINIDKNFYWF